MNHKSEGEIQKEIVDYLEAAGWLVFRMNSGKVRYNVYMNKKGTPDLFVVRRGKAYWFEVKTATGKLSEAQKLRHRELEEHGQKVKTVRSLDDVLEVIG